ncbi:unnamed protein product [Spodoptera exigua]|uniref:Uncharacterized protein n=1 Tax=Spodoptera exigua TaxID=7107 RepID=A0A835G2V2_SPOEX|nr:hypothetical protein HW555_013485 [Spodoptera exigua]KAH9628806.1 hypothetical protein HF086_004966 [Spodoptera exigua]CAH0691766.1 unnamed protein product [Spodoptera exigua]
MKQGLLVFLSICALTTAMVPRVRRAMNTEDDDLLQAMSTTSTTTTSGEETRTCAYQTPCAWTVYRPGMPAFSEMYIPNKYCVCASGTVCKKSENDTSANTHIHRCRPPSPDDNEES